MDNPETYLKDFIEILGDNFSKIKQALNNHHEDIKTLAQKINYLEGEISHLKSGEDVDFINELDEGYTDIINTNFIQYTKTKTMVLDLLEKIKQLEEQIKNA